MAAMTMADIVEEVKAQKTVAARPGLEYARCMQDLRSGSRTSRHTSGKAYVRARASRSARRESGQ